MKNGILGLKNLNDRQRKTILRTNTVYEFDDRVTAPENGFLGAVDYYKSCSAKFFIHEIKVPTLIVSAKNDPWVPSTMYSSIARCKLKNVKIILPEGGGHVGFHDRRGCWYHRVFHQFISELSC
jgi:predicted alpha/beta-fold hydrolase